MGKQKQPDQREIALDILLLTEESGTFSNRIIDAALDKYAYLPEQQKGLIRRLCDGCIRERIYLDHCIDHVSKTKTNRMKKLILVLLRMGAYQLLRMQEIPPSAAVNEAVKLAKKRGFSSLSGFVNGVLRSLDREKDRIPLPDPEKEREAYLSVRYSMPLWLVTEIEEGLPKGQRKESEKIFAALLEKRPLSARFSERMTSLEKESLLTALAREGVSTRQSKKLAYAYYLENVRGIKDLPGFREGQLYFQDVGSMLVVEKAGIKSGDLVLDVCAAPGGKALHAAEKLPADEKGNGSGLKGGSVMAFDLTQEKVLRIRENIHRCGAGNITANVWDATVLNEELTGKADVVLADLPCSGLGVIGRKPDIKYHISPEQIAELSFLQRDILKVVSQYVKKGGILMYSTCTLTRTENEENRDWILENLPFSMEEEIRLLPGLNETDGFYMVRMRRKA